MCHKMLRFSIRIILKSSIMTGRMQHFMFKSQQSKSNYPRNKAIFGKASLPKLLSIRSNLQALSPFVYISSTVSVTALWLIAHHDEMLMIRHCFIPLGKEVASDSTCGIIHELMYQRCTQTDESQMTDWCQLICPPIIALVGTNEYNRGEPNRSTFHGQKRLF